jgi:signal transduction histidine kinase
MSDANVMEIGPVNRELDLSIGQRLSLGFGALLLVMLAFAIAVLVWHSQSVAAQRDYTDRIAPVLQRVDAVERGLLYVAAGMRSYVLVPEPQRLANYRSYVEQTRRALTLLANASALPDGAPDIQQINASARAYLEETERLVAKRRSAQITAEEEAALFVLRERALTNIHTLVDLQSAHTDRSLNRMSAALDKASTGLVALTIGAALLSLALAWFTAQSIRRPAKALMRAAAAMERGDWKPALHLAPSEEELHSSRSEMRRLANAIGSAAAALEHREWDLREKNETIQSQNEELRTQYEQIQAQNEELQAQNQQIQAQSEELQAQAEELQSRGEELQAQNEELAQQGVELRAHSDALLEANERMNHFLGVLAHELRNPLAPISNSIFILKRVEPGSDQALRAQAVIERQTRHMIRLIDDLLDVTRISQGKIRVQNEPVDIADAVRNCLEDQSTTMEQGGLHLSLDLPARPMRVRGDYTRICQVFGNLLSNAIKFTNSGGTVSVSLREDDKNKEAVLEVQDTGLGLEPSLIPQLFRPFSQGTNDRSPTNSGLGLGLALVKALVEMHNGTVTAHSAGANKGSRFTVRLPLDG